MKIVGIDFGHGELAASCWNSENKQIQHLKLVNTCSEISEKYKIPSELYFYKTNDGSFTYTLEKPSEDFYSLELGLKKPISEMGDENKERYRIFIQLVYQRLRECNSELLHDNDFRLAIACPTKWSNTEKAAYKEFFEKALGIQIYAIMNESDAAFFAKYNKEDDRNNNILVVDYGSSTIDFTFLSKGKKVELDEFSSSSLGAICIEKTILATYAADDSAKNNYNAISQRVNSILKDPKAGLDWINTDNFILKNIREKKEKFFTYREQRLEEINYIPYHNAALEVLQDDACRFQYELRDRLMDVKGVREYRDKVKNQFIALKERIKQEGQIDKIIMSGGACMMSWVREDIKEVFDIDEDRILLDHAPSFVVCDGIVKYCQALAECIEKNKAEIDRIDLQKMMQESDVDTLNIISSRDIKKVMEEWKNNGNSILDLVNNICIKCYATYNSGNVTFVTEFKKQMSERITSIIQVIIKDIITKVFGNTNIETDDYSYIHASNLCYSYIKVDDNNNEDWSILERIGYYLLKYIEDHVSNWDWSFVHFYELYTIDYEKKRTSSERREIISTLSGNHFKWIFENIDSKIGITYNPINAENIQAIKDDILNYALRLIEEKQLFKTTFTR